MSAPKEKIEAIKDIVAELDLDAAKKEKLQSALSELRTLISVVDRLCLIAETHQSVYAVLCDKLLDKLANRHSY